MFMNTCWLVVPNIAALMGLERDYLIMKRAGRIYPDALPWDYRSVTVSISGCE
jgi:hypothetical protein